MANNTENKEQSTGFEQIQSTLTKTELFIEKNYKVLIGIVGAIILLVLGWNGVKQFYLEPRNKEAQDMIFQAQYYFEADAYKEALKGDGRSKGFLKVIDEYGFTKTGNLACFYAGISYLKLGEYKNAIEYFEKFDADSEIFEALTNGGIGDAYSELKDFESALKYYKKASKVKNNYTAPKFLSKYALVAKKLKKQDIATEAYKTLVKEYPNSFEAKYAEKMINE